MFSNACPHKHPATSSSNPPNLYAVLVAFCAALTVSVYVCPSVDELSSSGLFSLGFGQNFDSRILKSLKMPFPAVGNSSNFMPIFRTFRSETAAQNAGKSLRLPSNVLMFCALINYQGWSYISFMYVGTLAHKKTNNCHSYIITFSSEMRAPCCFSTHSSRASILLLSLFVLPCTQLFRLTLCPLWSIM